MEEKKLNPKENENLNIPKKLSWEAPKLYSLDKGKTEGGTGIVTYEDAYFNLQS